MDMDSNGKLPELRVIEEGGDGGGVTPKGTSPEPVIIWTYFALIAMIAVKTVSSTVGHGSFNLHTIIVDLSGFIGFIVPLTLPFLLHVIWPRVVVWEFFYAGAAIIYFLGYVLWR